MKWMLHQELQGLCQSSDPFTDLMQLKGESFRKTGRRETLRFEYHNQAYFIKKHFGVGWGEIFKNLLLGRKAVLGAATEYQAIQAFQKLPVHTLECVGFAQRGLNPATQRSFLITKAIENTLSLEELAQQWQENKPDFLIKNTILNEVARIARCIHQQGLFHRDFYLCHFLIDQQSLVTGDPRLTLIDLHRVYQPKLFKKRWLIKDLSAILFSSLGFSFTTRDYLRFIVQYTQKPLRAALVEDSKIWHTINLRAHRLTQRIRR